MVLPREEEAPPAVAPSSTTSQSTTDKGSNSQDPLSLFLSSPDIPRVKCNTQNAKIWYNAWDDTNEILSFDGLAQKLCDIEDPCSGVIVIEGLDREILTLVTKTFPDPLLFLFLHQHAARVEAPQIQSNGHIKSETRTFGLQTKDIRSSAGLHFDGFCSPVVTAADSLAFGGPENSAGAKLALTFANSETHVLRQSYRSETFVSDGSKWSKTSTRISCCMLVRDLYLVLVDPPLEIPKINMEAVFKSSFPVLPKDPYDRARLPSWQVFNAFDTMRRVFKNFPTRDVLTFMSQMFVEEGKRTDSVFHCLLTVSEWQSITDQLERDLRRLQSEATTSLAKTTLNALGRFRRILPDMRDTIADNELRLRRSTGMAMLTSVSGQRSQSNRSQVTNFGPGTKINLNGTNPVFSINASQEDHATEAINVPDLLDRLALLGDRLGVMAQTVNDDIQLFIASVSIRDSETMMADSKRTNLLTILAGIFLPLQLITGIFGMNIKEITGDSPSSWWVCLVALGICVVFTLMVFLGVRGWSQWRESQRMKQGHDNQERKEV